MRAGIRQEFQGGHLWSPKRKSNHAINPFYEFMREVAPGGVILSFQNTRIVAIGIAQSSCYEAPKPVEFGSAGMNWSNIGWKVEVRYFPLTTRTRPADEMTILGPLLPGRYSPLQANGSGLRVWIASSIWSAVTASPGVIATQIKSALTAKMGCC
jgi:hypothetical protein